MSDYIQLTNISKTFGKQTVLQPLTMGFEEGMIHGAIYPSLPSGLYTRFPSASTLNGRMVRLVRL